MAMDTERSKPLHNFTFPVGLRWGKQRFLRCVKVDSDGPVSPLRQFASTDADPSDHHHHQLPIDKPRTGSDMERGKHSSASELLFLGSHQMGSRRISEGEDDGFAGARESVKLHFQTAADELRGVAFKDGAVSVSPVAPHSTAMAEEGEIKGPWNLRKRRAAGKTLSGGFAIGENGGAPAADVGGRDLRVVEELSRLRSGGDVAAICGENLKREKFSVALSKREIAEDFLVFTGHKPARRPKKRTRIVQRELDTLFPGLRLTEITADMYKVSEVAA